MNNITDNKKFWNITRPLFSNKGGGRENILLVDGDKIISDDAEVAQNFNDFYKNPSIVCIKENVKIDNRFSFSEVNVDDIQKEIKLLSNKKAGTFMIIPTK